MTNEVPKRKLQIGIMGSAADLTYSKKTIESAEKIGELLAQQGATVVFGAEKDVDSLSTAASRGARRVGGLTVGITYGKDKNIYEKADVIIPTGLERGGGREFSLALACDSIIMIGGGSGTLSEVAAAYQAVTQATPNGIPVIALAGTGGWADKLAGKPLDERNRQIFTRAESPEEAAAIAIQEASKVWQRRTTRETQDINSISLFSTRATDILIKNDEVIAKQDGGPMMFIEDTFKETGVPYQIVTGEKLDVQICITSEGEFGKIQPAKTSRRISEIPSSWTVVSSIFNEWDPASLDTLSGKVFVDIQGFVRDVNDFGKKKIWEDIVKYKQNVFCLKGTREEISYLPTSVIEDQKNRLLVITDGSKGVEIFYQGNNFYIPTQEVINCKDTIGAGDTFFGYFIAAMYDNKNPDNAARIAIAKTADFLKKGKI